MACSDHAAGTASVPLADPRGAHLCAGPGRACRQCGWSAALPSALTASVCPSPGSPGCCRAAAAAEGRPSLRRRAGRLPHSCRRRPHLSARRAAVGRSPLVTGSQDLCVGGRGKAKGFGAASPTAHLGVLPAAAVPAADHRTWIVSECGTARSEVRREGWEPWLAVGANGARSPSRLPPGWRFGGAQIYDYGVLQCADAAALRSSRSVAKACCECYGWCALSLCRRLHVQAASHRPLKLCG